ncbi:unnamed protein product [Brassica oleracea var. botrytis]
MEDQNQTSFTFMIDNLSDKRTESPKFLNGGWEWVCSCLFQRGRSQVICVPLPLACKS